MVNLRVEERPNPPPERLPVELIPPPTLIRRPWASFTVRRTLREVGMKRVESPTKLLIWGLASIVAAPVLLLVVVAVGSSDGGFIVGGADRTAPATKRNKAEKVRNQHMRGSRVHQ